MRCRWPISGRASGVGGELWSRPNEEFFFFCCFRIFPLGFAWYSEK